MSSASDLPSVAVVVATRGRPHLLAGLVESVLADPGAKELVVVVDGEEPGDPGKPTSMSVLASLQGRWPRLTAIAVERSGHLAALEFGVRHADADVVLLLDDDVLPVCHLSTGHARHHLQRGLVVVGSMPVLLPARRHIPPGTLLYAQDYEGHAQNLREGAFGVLDHLWMGNISLRRSDCLEIGLTSTVFTATYHEDRDLGLRLARRGLVGISDESLAAIHLHKDSPAAFLNSGRRHGAGLAHLHEVHLEQLGPFRLGQVVDDLPSLLRSFVVLAGSSRTAPRVARALLRVGITLGHLGWSGAEIKLARLARRIMVCHGSVAGEAEPAPGRERAALRPANLVAAR